MWIVDFQLVFWLGFIFLVLLFSQERLRVLEIFFWASFWRYNFEIKLTGVPWIGDMIMNRKWNSCAFKNHSPFIVSCGYLLVFYHRWSARFYCICFYLLLKHVMIVCSVLYWYHSSLLFLRMFLSIFILLKLIVFACIYYLILVTLQVIINTSSFVCHLEAFYLSLNM
jgi:hypothetical protein